MPRYPTLVAAAAALFAMSPALAQQDPSADYPNRPVKIIVSVPAGGGVDTVTRIFAAGLQQHLGQPFVIENRGGAGGNIGAETVYAAEPDGYTLLASQPAPITSNVALYKKLNFDPAALESVAVMAKFPNVLLVRQDFPAKTAQEFIAYAKANPGKLTFASQGPGTSSHLTAELFMKLTGTKMLHVPYRGTGPALNDLVAGSRRFHLHGDCFGLQAARGRQGQDSRGRDRPAARCPAEHPDADRGRRIGLRLGHLECHQRAAQDTGCDRFETEPGGQRRPQRGGHQGALPRAPARRRRRQSAGHGQAQARRDRALDQSDPRGRHSAGVNAAGASSNNVGGELVLDMGNAVAQVELALLEPLNLQQVGPRGMLQGGDRGVEVAVLLLQARQLLSQLAFFVFGHCHR